MNPIAEGIREALRLLANLDPEVMSIAGVSLKVSLISTAVATLLGLPMGFALATREFTGRGVLITFVNTLLALPTVVVGLVCFAILSRQGPLGVLGLLYTPVAMAVGQTILAAPIVTALTLSAVQAIDPRVAETARTLGATRRQLRWTMLVEARFAVLAAIITAFGRVVAEVGISLMIGGNIRHYTRNLTTAIALETSKGEFGLGLALGVILMALGLVVNGALHLVQQWER
ncbi:MAG: ABC transporter permease [bacterium]|jgi:tungstate transport system permease protein